MLPQEMNKTRISALVNPAGEEPDVAGKGDLPPGSLLNMEMSTLSFNERVLVLAEDPDVPLLERVRFVSILGSNLDEFFMTRVAGFKRQLAADSRKRTLDGLTAREQLDGIAANAHPLIDRAYAYLLETLLPALADQGIRVLRWDELKESERDYLRGFYSEQTTALLAPRMVDPRIRFPHIRNLRPALAVSLRAPEDGSEHAAIIEMPGDLPRFVPLPGGRRFVPLEEVICAGLDPLFPGFEILGAYVFRVARSANFNIDEEDPDEVLEAVEEEVAKRPFQAVVRLEVEQDMPAPLRERIFAALQDEAEQRTSTLEERDIYTVPGLVDLRALAEIASLPIPELRYPPLRRGSPLPAGRPIFEVLREQDVLIRFPTDSFEATVERFLAEAVDDPDVESVKITLYRTDRASRIVKLLHRARRKGKQVAAMIELMASFDERRNIEWARSLETAGIDVLYGPPRLKVHAKVALIERREGDILRRYLYIGTGNLNAATAAGYTDLGLLSADPALGEELSQGFRALAGESGGDRYEHLLVAPFTMRDRFLAMIERETEHARAGRGGYICAKLNGIADRDMIDALYRASQAGVRIDLSVRGICCLRPGMEGYSENIRVVSILGRFLEHARIFRFANAGDPEYFIGSADWRPRNLNRRVEVITPVLNPAHCARLDEILAADLQNPDGWELRPAGSYVQGQSV